MREIEKEGKTKGSRVGEFLEESGSGSETKLEHVLKRCRDAETESKEYVRERKAGRKRGEKEMRDDCAGEDVSEKKISRKFLFSRLEYRTRRKFSLAVN